PAKLARRHAFDLQEAPVEVRDVVEAHVVADAGDVAVRLHQQQTRAADAYAIHEVDEVVPGSAPEEAREAALGHAELAGKLAERRRVREIRSEAVDDGV